ncbi:hypothetical protein AB205_0103760 [Aquarana catesbeiana]|uniref:Uncharacterized protein n=1 Tax=Aquarana catesbeiana TaxID=8400 RepID=A0A2G9RNB2_AQUCT|nr:hypothetical protein AB205_0103760 [Aquarana catesbeiana]
MFTQGMMMWFLQDWDFTDVNQVSLISQGRGLPILCVSMDAHGLACLTTRAWVPPFRGMGRGLPEEEVRDPVQSRGGAQPLKRIGNRFFLGYTYLLDLFGASVLNSHIFFVDICSSVHTPPTKLQLSRELYNLKILHTIIMIVQSPLSAADLQQSEVAGSRTDRLTRQSERKICTRETDNDKKLREVLGFPLLKEDLPPPNQKRYVTYAGFFFLFFFLTNAIISPATPAFSSSHLLLSKCRDLEPRPEGCIRQNNWKKRAAQPSGHL